MNSQSPSFTSIRGHTFYSPALGVAPRVLDLARNQGRFAQEMSERFGAKVCMVEANPDLYQELSTRGSLPAFHCAVMHEEGTVPFNLAKNNEGSSVLNLPLQSKYDCVHRETVAIRARTVASILDEIGWDSVDLIKMDIEGAEVQVLDSLGTDVLDRIKQLTIEFHSARDFGFNLHDKVEACLKRLRKLGFCVMDFSLPGRYDVLLINTKHIKLDPINRARWRLTYDPPEPLYRLREKMRFGLRARLRRWRKWLARPFV